MRKISLYWYVQRPLGYIEKRKKKGAEKFIYYSTFFIREKIRFAYVINKCWIEAQKMSMRGTGEVAETSQ